MYHVPLHQISAPGLNSFRLKMNLNMLFHTKNHLFFFVYLWFSNVVMNLEMRRKKNQQDILKV